MENALKFIAQGPAVFTNPLPNNQNMNSRTIDPSCASSVTQNPLEALVVMVALTWCTVLLRL